MSHTDVANSAGSVAAIASPYWLPSLHTISAEAADWLPILGAVCLSLQIMLWLLRIWRTYRSK